MSSVVVTVRFDAVGAAFATGVAMAGPATVPLPALFTARTSKAYAAPLVRPDRVTPVLSAATAVHDALSGTIEPSAWRYSYPVTAAPKWPAGAVQDSSTFPMPGVAVKRRGAPGGARPLTAMRYLRSPDNWPFPA